MILPSEEAIKTLKHFAKTMIGESLAAEGKLRPMAFFSLPNGHVAAMDMPPGFMDDAHFKDFLAYILRVSIQKLNATAMAFASECWRVNFALDDPEATEKAQKAYEEGIQDHPDRIEAVLLTIDTPAWSGLMTASITRDEGKITLGEFQEWPSDKFESRWTNLFRPAAEGNA